MQRQYRIRPSDDYLRLRVLFLLLITNYRSEYCARKMIKICGENNRCCNILGSRYFFILFFLSFSFYDFFFSPIYRSRLCAVTFSSIRLSFDINASRNISQLGKNFSAPVILLYIGWLANLPRYVSRGCSIFEMVI